MQADVSRDVISDLWPVYAAGEASPDTRALVESFLAADPAFAHTLHESSGLSLGSANGPVLSPDHELDALARTRKRIWGHLWLLQLAMLFSALAFGRIVSDTSWDVSPRNFIVIASMAAAFWVAFLVSLYRVRARILIVTPGSKKSTTQPRA